MQEVASSTHSHAAHAQTHAARHAKPQSGSDFAALLDEMEPQNSDASPDASTPVAGQSPAPEQTSQAAAKAVDTSAQAQIATTPAVPAPMLVPAPSAGVVDPDQQLKAACPDGKNPLPIDPKPVSPAEPKPEQKTEAGETNQPTITDTAVLPSGVSQTGNTALAVAASPPQNVAPPAVAGPAVAASPAAAPAQPAVERVPVQATPPIQQTQPIADPALAQGATRVTPVASPAVQKMSADVKSPKPGQGQASAQPDADDEPQGVAAPAAEQGAPKLVDAKPAIPAAAAQTADKGVTPAHRPSSDVAAKSDAPQTFDDLLNAPTTQTGAASNGLAAATANQTGSAPSVAAASNAPAPQNLLGPVPLSGIPVLIAGKALAGSNQFDIRLDPPELGRIEVRLKIDRDGQVSSHLIADRADTLALLRSDQTGLERALQDAGLKTAGDGLQFSLRDQGGNAQPDGRSASPNLLVQDNSNPIPDLPMRGYVAYATRAGGIDIHV